MEQKKQNYSQVLHKVLSVQHKMRLRARVTKDASSLIQNKTITAITVNSLRAIINRCRLTIKEDERHDVLV